MLMPLDAVGLAEWLTPYKHAPPYVGCCSESE